MLTVFPMAYAGNACDFWLIPSDGYLQNKHLDRLTIELTHYVPLACILMLTLYLGPKGESKPGRTY
jgi:hypothetical protein